MARFDAGRLTSDGGALNSPHVKREIEYALGTKSYTNRLIPVVIGDRERLPQHGIPWILRTLPWFELDDREHRDAEMEHIANAIRSHA